MKRFDMKIALIRGSYLNPNELANYSPLVKSVKIMSFSSRFMLGSDALIPNRPLWSLNDLPRIFPPPLLPLGERAVKFLANRSLGDAQILFGLEKELRDSDILDTADPHYYYSLQAARVKMACPEKTLAVTYCETIPFNNEGTRRKKELKRLILAIADVVICHTERSKQAALCEGVPENKINIVRLGVDTKRFRPSRRKENLVLFVGRLTAEKGPETLLEAFITFARKYPRYKLLFIGQGELEGRLKHRVKEAGLYDRVDFQKLPYCRIHEAYQRAKIFVLPSVSTKTWEEQYGMVLLEAMASGLPIVTTDCGAIPEVVGNSAAVVPMGNVQALYRAFKSMAGLPEKSAIFGINARERAVKYFNRENFTKKLIGIYEKYQRRDHRQK